jgi:hypothetical protein
MLGAIVAVGIVAVACGSSDDASSPKGGGSESAAEPLTVTSEDGLLTLDVPADLVPEGEEITVTQRSGDEIPELAKAGLTGTVYELGPDGLEFADPVTVSRQVDPETVGTDIDEAMLVPLLAVRDSDGGWEWLEDQVVQIDPDDPSKVQVTGTTTHFSTVVAFGGLMEASMEFKPDWTTFSVGEKFTVALRLSSQAQLGDVKPNAIIQFAEYLGPALSFLDQGSKSYDLDSSDQAFTCAKAGSGSLEARPLLEGTSDDQADALLQAVLTEHIYRNILDGKRLAAIDGGLTVVLSEDVTCGDGAAAEDEEPVGEVGERQPPVLTGACGSWLHEAFRRFLSRVQILALFLFLEPGDTIFLRAEGVNGGKTIQKKVVAEKLFRSEGRKEEFVLKIQGGINELGPHPITRFEIVSEDGEIFDLTNEVNDRIGEFIVESDYEGEIGDCS